MNAAWLLVPAAAVLVVFVVASWRCLSPQAGNVADRLAAVGFYACLFVAAAWILGLLIYG